MVCDQIYLFDRILQVAQSVLNSQIHDVIEASKPLFFPFPFDAITLEEQRKLLNKGVVTVGIVNRYRVHL